MRLEARKDLVVEYAEESVVRPARITPRNSLISTGGTISEGRSHTFPAHPVPAGPRAHAGMAGLAGTRVSRHRGDEDGDWAIHQRLLWSGRRDSNPRPHLGKAIRLVLPNPGLSCVVRPRWSARS
jgi:hypothetical protein